MNGKGSGRRPASVNDDMLAQNWERTFGVQPTRTNEVKQPEMKHLEVKLPWHAMATDVSDWCR